MSAEKLSSIVSKLIHDAERESNPARLRLIAEKLDQQGAWQEAMHVRIKAREVEGKYAEQAAK